MATKDDPRVVPVVGGPLDGSQRVVHEGDYLVVHQLGGVEHHYQLRKLDAEDRTFYRFEYVGGVRP